MTDSIKPFYRLYPNDKFPNTSVCEKHGLDKGYVFVHLQEDGPKKFYWFETVDEADAFISQHDDPRFSSVMIKENRVRFNVELDLEHEKLDLITLDERTKKLVANHNANPKNKDKPLDMYAIKAWHAAQVVQKHIGGLIEEWHVDPDQYIFLQATDNEREDPKKSYRIYMKLSFKNRLHYKHFMKQLKESVPPQYANFIDTTGLFLRMPNNYKKDHVCKWITLGAQFKDAVLSYTEDCDPLEPPGSIDDDVKEPAALDNEEVKKAVEILNKHPHIKGNFEYIGETKGFLQFRRSQPSHCKIHDREHDTVDCFATIYKGHINIHCYRDEVKDADGGKKKIYVGYIGKEVVPIRIKMAAIKKAMTDMKKNIQSKLSNTEMSGMAENNKKEFEILRTRALLHEDKVMGEIGDDPQRTNKTKYYPQYQHKLFYYHHFKHFNKSNGTLPSLNIVWAWIENTVFKIINGGNSFWVTLNYDYKAKMLKYVTLTRAPFGSAEDKLMISYINPAFDFKQPAGKDNPMEITDSLYSIIVNHRLAHFHNDVDVVPFLKDGDEKKIHESIFNIFPRFKFKYEEKKYELDNEGIPIPPNNIKHWVDHYKFIPPANAKKTFLQWFAYGIQHPDNKAFNVLIYGKKGTGKSIIYESYKRMIGDYFCKQITKLDQVTGRFNKRLEGKQLINVNEATDFPTIRDWNVFKSLTTEIELEVEPKGKECYNVNFYGKFLTTTNSKFAARVTADDRRNFCIQIKDDHRNKTPYFKDMIKDLHDEDDEVFKELFTYFANFPIDGFEPQRPPMTKYKMELIGEQCPELIQFMREVCENCSDVAYPDTEDSVFLSAKLMYQHYKEWCRSCECKPKRKGEFYSSMVEKFGLSHLDRHTIDGVQKRCYKVDRLSLLERFKEHTANVDFAFNVADGGELD